MSLSKAILTYCMVGSVFFYSFSCKDDKPVNAKPLEVKFKKEGHLQLLKNDSIITSLDIEIADDDYQIQTGLMYRSNMENNRGMLFIFPNERPRSFYMKNTRIPLDIIYFDTNKKLVSIQKDAKPFDETSLPSDGIAQYVLEVNAGLTDDWNLQVGDQFRYNKY
ncbi:DUF192 domain-containing protein [Ichthyenterobacterium sp. W332]|uniref:DUF192 domain-containing protein n=1 Tax=Microcosmobacter mediterraneus TaxID=3075607 RepID=A0ABU2YP65_9FLAO|nr:DUF192 domain-containing protein [Ichthyenterobacterium sp. W332]MDT0559622.1 DUF192 domain-containing protein [Ichthyenterobacterium sp. W332]